MKRFAGVVVASVAAVACGKSQPQPQPQPEPVPQPVVVDAAVAVVDAAPARTPIDLATLPAWPGHVEGAAVQVHVADVDVDTLRTAVAPRKEPWIVLPVDRRVTGRVSAPTRAAAYAALLAADPSIAPSRPVLRGGGTHVDLDFAQASGADLFRLFADVSRTSIVQRTSPPKVTIRVKRAGVQAVMTEVARVSGLVLDRPAKSLIVVRTPAQPATPRLSTKGPKVRLDGREVLAGHALALLAALERAPGAPPDFSTGSSAAGCDGGAPITLRVRDLPRDGVRQLVALLGDVNPAGPRCSLAPVRADDLATLALVAVATQGTRKLALGVVGDRAVLIDDADPSWDVGDAFVTVRDAAGQERSLTLHPGLFAAPAATAGSAASTLARARLMLTLIDDTATRPDERRLAVIELDGEARWLRSLADLDAGGLVASTQLGDVFVVARVTPGAVELFDPDTRTPLATLRLEPLP